MDKDFKNPLLKRRIPTNGIAKNSPRRFRMKRVITYYELCRQLPPAIDIPDERSLRWLCEKNGVEFETMRKPWECHRQRVDETLVSLNAPVSEQFIALELLPQDDGD